MKKCAVTSHVVLIDILYIENCFDRTIYRLTISTQLKKEQVQDASIQGFVAYKVELKVSPPDGGM